MTKRLPTEHTSVEIVKKSYNECESCCTNGACKDFDSNKLGCVTEVVDGSHERSRKKADGPTDTNNGKIAH